MGRIVLPAVTRILRRGDVAFGEAKKPTSFINEMDGKIMLKY